MDYLTLESGGATFALPLEYVVEVLRAVQVTPLPGAPAGVAGVVNVRGEPLAVVDLRVRPGAEPAPMRATEHLVRVQLPARQVLVRADHAGDLVNLDGRSIAETNAVVAEGAGSVAGIARLADGVLLILDPGKFLSAAEAGMLDAALARQSAADE